MSEQLKKTPLNEVHRASGAKMVDFGGWDMPVQYSGIIDEHQTVRNAVGLFDVSHMGEIEIRGPQALDLVNYISTNNAAKLKTGQAHYSGLLYEHGGFVDDILVHKVADDHYFICVNASNQDKDYEHIVLHSKGFDATVENAGPRYAQIAVQGPKGPATLQKLTATDLAQIKYYRFVHGEVDGTPAIIARTGYTGEDGFEVYVAPGGAARIWRKLLAAGSEFGIVPAGLGARDTLRFEACMPLYGNDIDDTTTPFEAGLDWIVKLEKGGFLGREPLFRQKAEGIKRKLVGFEMTGRGIARHGYPIWSGDGQIGTVTSGTHAPSLGKPLGLGYVPLGLAAPGSRIEVEIRGQHIPAEVVEIPFYRRAR